MRARKPLPGQLRIDFDFYQRQAIVTDCILPPLAGKHGGRVAMGTAKLVLAIINRHAGGKEAFLSFDLIAERTGKSTRQIKRVVEALVERSLLIVEHRRTPNGRACNHYRIVWTELALFRPGKSQPENSDILDENSDILGVKNVTQSNPRKQPLEATPSSPPDSWRQAEDFLKSSWHPKTVARIIQAAQGLGQSPEQARQAAALALQTVQQPDNARILTNPLGAAAGFLIDGRWPVAGIRTADDCRRAAQAAEVDYSEQLAQASIVAAEQAERERLQRFRPRLLAMTKAELRELIPDHPDWADHRLICDLSYLRALEAREHAIV